MLATTLPAEMAALTRVLPQEDKDGTIAGKENRETFGGKLHETIIIVALFLSFGLVVGVVVMAVRVGQFVYKKKHVDDEIASTQRVEKIVKINLLGGNKDNLSVVSVVRTDDCSHYIDSESRLFLTIESLCNDFLLCVLNIESAIPLELVSRISGTF